MIAAEKGDLNAVKYFINKRFDESYEIDKKVAIDLVDKNSPHYSEIVLSLLKANSRYPRNFDEKDKNLCKDLKDFINDMHKMHEAVKEEKKPEILSLIQKYPKLRYFFAPRNKSQNSISAYKTAEKSRQSEILHLFKENSIIKASFEFRRFNSGEIKNAATNKINKGINFVRQFSNDKDDDTTEMLPLHERSNGHTSTNGSTHPPENSRNSDNPPNRTLWSRLRHFASPIGNFFAARHRKEQDRRATVAAASSHDSA